MTKVVEVTRVFKYGTMELNDPDPTMTPEAVMAFYANIYPELNQGVVEGGEIKNNRQEFKLSKAVGTKGAKKGGVTLDEFAKNPDQYLDAIDEVCDSLTSEQVNTVLMACESYKKSGDHYVLPTNMAVVLV